MKQRYEVTFSLDQTALEKQLNKQSSAWRLVTVMCRPAYPGNTLARHATEHPPGFIVVWERLKKEA